MIWCDWFDFDIRGTWVIIVKPSYPFRNAVLIKNVKLYYLRLVVYNLEYPFWNMNWRRRKWPRSKVKYSNWCLRITKKMPTYHTIDCTFTLLPSSYKLKSVYILLCCTEGMYENLKALHNNVIFAWHGSRLLFLIK